ncbi:anthranilate synthase component I family protein [Phenylobacterium immobile]|uniref:anthranilate synthase component I family protein n=1 Tax=Phenylobacterium immobile TaxID=21 RepID=UPI000B30BDDF|nr:anthranilate synthase component I family protein [Phenylobacterium immobile]
MEAPALITAPWRDPAEVAAALGEQAWTLAFLSGGDQARWSYVMADPAETLMLAPSDSRPPIAALRALTGRQTPARPGGPPFQGGVAGLMSYELGDRFEPLGLGRHGGWPDLACARYEALLAFDHQTQRVLAIGRDDDAARATLAWLDRPAPTPTGGQIGAMASDDGAAYEAAVAEVTDRIAAGEIFQANIARRWIGRLAQGRSPSDLVRALAAASPAPFAAYLRLEDHAVVSNSPERFIRVTGEEARTEPIKGTAPRGATPDEDRALAQALVASEKDRAENLMIVDLMRNDLSRVCAPGTVKTPELFTIATFANVHHLVSVVTGKLAAGRDALDLMAAAFPPGSITGAPKVQAMKVIAGLEAPRGPFFGAMFMLGSDGSFDSNVLIRTAALVRDGEGWAIEARAGAGIVADSEPLSERLETEAKISALRKALAG